MALQSVPYIAHFAELAPRYDVLLSDVWGVVHDGVIATPAACDALIRFRERGGTVILITNAPRPGEVVTKFTDKVGVPREAYDGIVSSGDVTRAVMALRPGKRVFHLGPERDLPIFEGLDVQFVTLQEADYVVCTGLRDDDNETAENYRDELAAMHDRGLVMLCGNPDLVVGRGDKLIHCAGAIADLYGTLGGEVIYAGKPHAPIYDQALALAAARRGGETSRARVLAIGDSVRTDLTGAARAGLDFLFVTAGIHAEELGTEDRPDPAALRRMLSAAEGMPIAIMRELAW